MSKGNRIKASVKAPSGGAKLKAAGRHPILLGVSAEQLKALRIAAGIELRPVTQFVLFHAMAAAAKADGTLGRLLADERHHSIAASSSTKTPRKRSEVGNE